MSPLPDMIIFLHRAMSANRFPARISCLLLLTGIVILFALPEVLPGKCMAGETAQEGKGEKAISGFKIQIRRLEEGILRQENDIAENETTVSNVLADIETLDTKLSQQQEKLAELEKKLAHQQELINREEKALKKINTDKGFVEEHLKKRIKAYYTMGDIGLLNVTFSTKTLPELLTFHDAFNSLIQYDQDVIRVYHETIREVERTTRALSLEQTVLQQFASDARDEQEKLAQTKTEKETLVTRIKTQVDLQKQAVNEMQAASKSLSKSIADMKKKVAEQAPTFQNNKGNLPPPVDGAIITLFQQEKTNKLGVTRKCQGIELQVPDNTKIVAVSAGDIVYAGYLRGYGNTVIIDHGFKYFTITSRMEKILVNKGQKIKTEEPIGIAGSTATLFDEGLYFEIRYDHQSLDPLLWLNPNRLSTQHEPPPADPAASE